MPHGAMGELIPTLEALRDQPTSVVLGLRDILDAPAVVRDAGGWRALTRRSSGTTTRYWSTARPTSSTLPPSTGGLPPPKRSSRYCGYVCAAPPRRRRAGSSRPLSCAGARDARLIVAMAGGGADAYPLIDALLRAAPAVIEARPPCALRDHHRAVHADPDSDGIWPERAQGLPGAGAHLGERLLSYLAAADVVVGMAGYNTTAEILRSARRRARPPARDPAPSSACVPGCSASAAG